MSAGALRRLALVLAVVAIPALARERPRIVIDAGHGGTQDGARGPAGLTEKALSLALSRKLGAALEKALQAQIVFTRPDDVLIPLPERVQQTNRAHPDLFISLHANSMPTRRQRERIEGIETYFLSADASGDDARTTAARENAEATHAITTARADTLSVILGDLARTDAHADSSRLAYAIHQKIIAATHAQDRGVQQAPFYVLSGVEAPAVLVEVGFISHPAEGKRLGDPKYQDALAAAVTEGVQAFLEQVERKDPKPPPADPQAKPDVRSAKVSPP